VGGGGRVGAGPPRRGCGTRAVPPGGGGRDLERAGRALGAAGERQTLRALQTNLRGAGYEVFTAATAAAALAEAAARQPDAVILDLVLPDGNGTDVVRELRTWSSAPVIVLSAVGREGENVARPHPRPA